MVIYYNDGSKLTCSEIEFGANCVYADKLYEIPIDDIEFISD